MPPPIQFLSISPLFFSHHQRHYPLLLPELPSAHGACCYSYASCSRLRIDYSALLAIIDMIFSDVAISICYAIFFRFSIVISIFADEAPLRCRLTPMIDASFAAITLLRAAAAITPALYAIC